MSEHILYLGTAILIAVSILTTKFAFSEPNPEQLRAEAAMIQQHYQLRDGSRSTCGLACLAEQRDNR